MKTLTIEEFVKQNGDYGIKTELEVNKFTKKGYEVTEDQIRSYQMQLKQLKKLSNDCYKYVEEAIKNNWRREVKDVLDDFLTYTTEENKDLYDECIENLGEEIVLNELNQATQAATNCNIC